MASPFQQQALQRKLIYTAVIVALFTVALGWRKWVMDPQAERLAVREQSRGEVELSGATIRLALTGMRGVATCVLWYEAMDKQKKNQWNELEVLVRSVSKLQPHFVIPWLFQSWNLAYNVSVEADRVSDKYFFITRGLELLAEGERQNLDNPDLRWSIGFYTQHKICGSDETNTMRSLYQLSCVPPNERDPARFWVETDGGRQLNVAEFEKFCAQHPQLMRRLNVGMHRDTRREQTRQFRCERPEDAVQFLADNFHLPSLYEDVAGAPANAWQPLPDKLRAVEERFPMLPPPRTAQPPQHVFDLSALTYESQLGDDADAYLVAHAWYCYAQEPLPDPSELPGIPKEITNRARQRKPRNMTALIFRNYPAQALRYSAERLQTEGWFDEDGWGPRWFEDRVGPDPVKFGGGRKWSLDAWRKARDAWQEHGEQNHLLFRNAAEEENTRALAKRYHERTRLPEGAMPPLLRDENLSAEERDEQFAARFLWEQGFYVNVSNFKHHLVRSRVEASEEAVKARKLFFEAEELNYAGSGEKALDKFNDPAAIKAWREQVLLKNPDFRQDQWIQEFNAELQWKYLRLHDRVHGRSLKGQLAKAAVGVPLLPKIDPDAEAFRGAIVPGPFDGTDEQGKPLLEESAKLTVLQRLGVLQYPKAGPPPGAVGPDGQPVPQRRPQ
jgi:hypothetical protein